MSRTSALLISGLVWASAAIADEVPISGTIKTIDADAQTLTIMTTVKGKTRALTVYLKPTSRIVRFTRSTEPSKGGFVEQAAKLAELKTGWVVSVTAKHDRDREVAEVVKVVFER